MGNIPFNSPKAKCTANQLRTKLDQKLMRMLNESKIIGPLDKYIARAFEEGFFDESVRDKLLEISWYCDNVLMSSDFTDIAEFKVLVEWSKLIDEL